MGVAYQPIAHRDIFALQEMRGRPFKDWERQALIRMDRIQLMHLNASKTTTTSERPVSPALFDALFGS